MELEELVKKYESKKGEIKKRIQEFREVLNQPDERIFTELAFCLCTPQSKATQCWGAVSSLVKNNLLFSGTEEKIKPFLNVVRFGDTKARHIVEARKIFSENGKISVKEKLKSFRNSFETREWLVENVMGLGMKESSHFLRNIGFALDLAILDRHILKNLHEHNALDELPKTLTEKKYLEIENKMKEFANKVGIPFEELDLLFWSEETGMIFK